MKRPPENRSAGFEERIRADDRVTVLFVRFMRLHALLERNYEIVPPQLPAGRPASKLQTPFAGPSVPASTSNLLSTTLHATLGYFPEGMPLAYLIATVIFSVRALGRLAHPCGRTGGGGSTIGFSPLSPLLSPLSGRPDHRHGRLQMARRFPRFLGAEA